MFALIWSNFTRNKGRKILTLLSLLIAFLLFGLLMALHQGLAFNFAPTGLGRLVTTNKVAPFAPMPVAYAERIVQVPGVKAVTWNGFMAGTFQKPSNFFMVLPAPADSLFRVYPDLFVSLSEKQSWLRDRTGALVTPKLMQQFGWKIGEKVPVQTQTKQKDGSTTWYMTIDGTIDNRTAKNSSVQQMFIHYSYYDQSRAVGQGTVNGFAELLDDPKEAGQVGQEIDNLFLNAAPQTHTVPEEAAARNIFAQAGNFGALITEVAVAVFFSLMLIIGAIILHSARERISEFAVLRALGFGSGAVSGVLLGEAILTCVVGGVAGLIVAFLLILLLKPMVTQVVPTFSLSPAAVGISVGLMVLFGILASVIPLVQLRRMSVRAALGRA